jgi:hypothetical protein
MKTRRKENRKHYKPETPRRTVCCRLKLQEGKTSQSQSQSTLRLTVGQSVSLGVEPHLGLMTRYLLLFHSYGLVFVGRPLWREDGSVFCICCGSSPPQSFSGPSPLDLPTIFYSLSFETSLFVACYDSQGHGGGIRPRLHTGLTDWSLLLRTPINPWSDMRENALIVASLLTRDVTADAVTWPFPTLASFKCL